MSTEPQPHSPPPQQRKNSWLRSLYIDTARRRVAARWAAIEAISNSQESIEHTRPPERNPMTIDECRIATREHIECVRVFLRKFAGHLFSRSEVHDASKLETPEVETFAEYTPKLRDCTYGSDEYMGYLIEMQKALAHHYAANDHHPEHFKNGIDGMNLAQLVEMFCDWKAATLRHADGDLRRSVEQNTERFKLSPQLRSILLNSVDLFE